MKALDLKNKICVTGRPQDSASMYKQANILNDMAYLGVDMMRCAAPQSSTIGWNTMGALGNAGVDFMFTMRHNRPYAQEISDLYAFNTAFPNVITLVEGPNEVNFSPVTWNGVTDPAAGPYTSAYAYQAQLNTDVPTWPVVDFTGPGYMNGSCDKANVHEYPRKGALLSTGWNSTILPAITAAYGPSKDIIISEIGFHTSLTDPNFPGTDEQTQARLTLNALLTAGSNTRVKRVFLYQLYDDGPDNGTMATKFGLFRYPDYSKKPAADAIRNLTQFLADSGVGTNGGNVSVTSTPGAYGTVTIGYSNGSNGLIIYPTGQIWNNVTKTQVAPPQIIVTATATQATISSVTLTDLITGQVTVKPVTANQFQMVGSNPIAIKWNI